MFSYHLRSIFESHQGYSSFFFLFFSFRNHKSSKIEVDFNEKLSIAITFIGLSSEKIFISFSSNEIAEANLFEWTFSLFAGFNIVFDTNH